MFLKILFFVVLFYLFRSILRNSTFVDFLKTLLPTKKEERFEEEKEEIRPLGAKERFALALGDLEHERIAQTLQKKSLRTYLEEECNLTFEEGREREHTLYTLHQIWKVGTIEIFFDNPDVHSSLSVRDMVAFDSARFTELLRQALYLNFINEEDAWGFLFLNAQRVQESYEGWEDFRDAYFRGVALMHYSELKEDDNFDFEQEFKRLRDVSNIKVAWLEEEIFATIEVIEKFEE